MTRPIRFDPVAQRELNEAADFYDAEDPGLGGAFLGAAERAFEGIQAFPESPPISRIGRPRLGVGVDREERTS
jgi:hypothetical protein